MEQSQDDMNTDISHVLIGEELTAVRISFTYNNKFYARQFAITSEVDEPKAVALCKAYQDRVLVRNGVTEQYVRQIMAESAQQLVQRSRAKVHNPEACNRAKNDVQTVLKRYSTTNSSLHYTNVYGKSTETQTAAFDGQP